MRVLILLDGQHLDREIDRYSSETTLAQLITAAGATTPAPASLLYVDDVAVQADTPLGEVTLLEGSTIAVVPRARPSSLQRWSVSLSGGLDSGSTIEVPGNRPLIVGRSPGADLYLGTESASWEHCTIEREESGLRVRDSGSTNGTFVEGVKVDAEGVAITQPTTVLVGGTSLFLQPQLLESRAPEPGSLNNVTAAGTVPFNRPPRLGTPQGPEPLAVPTVKDVPEAAKFNLLSVLIPLVLAGVMVAVLGDARFAMFAALSPILGVGTWFEQKQRRARNLKAEDARFEQAVVDFSEDMRVAGRSESARRHDINPDPAAVLRRAAAPLTTLWQRRAGTDDFLTLSLGTGDLPWAPPTDDNTSTKLDQRVRDAIDTNVIRSAPIQVDLTAGGVVGIVGERAGALALARSLVAQASVHCGPADLSIGFFFDAGRRDEWEWASWLPHTRRLGSSTGERWLSDDRQRSIALLRGLREGIDEHPTPGLLLVLDSDVLTEGRDAPARSLLGHGRPTEGSSLQATRQRVAVSGIVIASTEDQLPAACTSVVTVGADAAITVHEPESLDRVEEAVLAGLTVDRARRCAMDLARLEDPELSIPGASLPGLVRLPELLGLGTPEAADIRRLWTTSTGFSTPIGAGESGVMSLDLVGDGPHGLVGGTTGSGKSEFLRSLVAGLAARNDPTRLNFILIDFKGGAAFAACERLPHTIGTISNLDEQLADRALRSLEAEMQRRQRIFAAAGEDVDNLDAYLATNPSEPMPRLLLVVDEFAMLAKDFPDVLSSLVSVGAVGRTLGVHMILATQRPAGVVNDDILANTNLRVALRVQSREDSSNVIGVPSAAGIGRAQTGRAFIKLGQDDITPVQTALVTGRAPLTDRATLELRETGPLGMPVARPKPPASASSDDSDLDLMIDAILGAHADAGYAAPRPVWPEALGARVSLSGFAVDGAEAAPVSVGAIEGSRVLMALSDEPELQRQSPAGWDLAQGNLMLLGIAGSGTSTTLSSIALTLAAAYGPDELDLLVLDVGSRSLAPLADLPHTAAYVGTGAGASEQQARFLRFLRTELDRRRADPGHRRPMIVLIDGLATLRDEFQDYDGLALMDALYRAYADGPALGLWFAISTTRAKAIPSAMDEVTTQKWLFRLADPYDYSSLGVRGQDMPAAIAGRCVTTVGLRQMHVATPDGDLIQAVASVSARWPEAAAKTPVIGSLPADITVAEVPAAANLSADPWMIPVGLRESDLAPATLEIYDGEHVLIAGPARSGKSTLLRAIADSLRSQAQTTPVAVWGIADRRSPLVDANLDRIAVGSEEVAALIASLRLERGPVVLLIDDAERFEDTDQSITNLLGSGRSQLCVIASGRSADLRSLYGHWTKVLRKSRCGVLLQPDVDYDGELLGVTLPRRSPVAATVGRGYVCVGGTAAFAQTMSPNTLTV
ncbi:FtsK/SpoIIIE domain-containing protein [Mycetocola sp. JXN-3]|uniref:FtsK/SpoIIIE domain-containing protein n=1 Tax=Mycetocola sp. JXN-3 TaxID=2116510 RepID=UPI00165CF075|nr:FtsK/SpoIIIE domain-containing protein [Mycetocola sp. JXN-3]